MNRLSVIASLFLAGIIFAAQPQSPSSIAADTLPKELKYEEKLLGLKAVNSPADNPITPDKVTLGRKLFFDPILSGDKTVACATCHHPDKAMAGNEALPRGIGGMPTKRKAPTLYNRGLGTSFFWDGRASSLEEQALMPIEDPTEMGRNCPK